MLFDLCDDEPPQAPARATARATTSATGYLGRCTHSPITPQGRSTQHAVEQRWSSFFTVRPIQIQITPKRGHGAD